MENTELFKVGEPVPLVWLHMEFDLNDTKMYFGGKVIPNKAEQSRLIKKYLL